MGRPARLSRPIKTRGISLSPAVWKAAEKRAGRKRLGLSRYVEELIKKDLGPDWPEEDAVHRYVHMGFKE